MAELIWSPRVGSSDPENKQYPDDKLIEMGTALSDVPASLDEINSSKGMNQIVGMLNLCKGEKAADYFTADTPPTKSEMDNIVQEIQGNRPEPYPFTNLPYSGPLCLTDVFELRDALAVVIVMYNGARMWSDGTYAVSCNAYRYPTGKGVYAGETGDGLYWIQPEGAASPYKVYGDMTTDGGGWTRLVYSSPAYYWFGQSIPKGEVEGFGHISQAWDDLNEFTQVIFKNGEAVLRAAGISNCWENETIKQQIDKGVWTCNDLLTVGSLPLAEELMFNPSRTYNDCFLQARVAYRFHTWDSGISGAYQGIGINGYKTNNTLYCGSKCVIYSPSCFPTRYTGAYGDHESFFVR